MTPWCVAALAIAVLFGWLIESRFLKSVVPGTVAMNPMTAVAFLLAAASAWFALPEHTQNRRLHRILAGAVVVIAVLRLAAYADFGDARIDRLLFAERLDRETIPNRMAPNTAFAFLLIGLSTLLIDSRAKANRRAARAGFLLVLMIAFVVLCGYAYSADRLVQIAGHIPMAVHTAAGFALLATGLLCSRPREGIIGEFVSDAVGGRMARALFPAVIGVPLVLGWLRIQGQRAGLYETEVGAALLVTAWIVVVTGLLCWQARSLNRADVERSRNEEQITALNTELHTRANELEALNRELEAFSYSVSHDLRAPLRSVTSFSQALLEDCGGRLDENGRDYLDRIVRAGRRMAELIDDILALSRVTRKELRLEPVDLSLAASEIVADLRESTPVRHVRTDIQAGVTATGDRQLLRVVLENLLGNAWKFTGRIPEARIAFRAAERVNGAGIEHVYSVHDNGAGFDMEYADKLFGVFQRLHGESEFPGSGIGLATVQRIVRRHGGRVWAEGTVGRGATFYFTL
ncbi:MAG TPA: ATP-binding protein [Gemmatimonadota bacterium]|nr:ATP-binding protein [Gemmatimonadota bacterium]